MTALLPLLWILASAGPLELEEAGALAEAGVSWQSEGNLPGQVRVLCRLLEEALYAGHANRAEWLIEDLESTGCDSMTVFYWRARLAWVCGLDSLAAGWMDRVEGDPWITHRAAGTALVYRGRGEEACAEFLESMLAGDTRRRRFCSAVDLCFAYTQAGRLDDAVELSGILVDSFPCEGLASFVRALALHGSGSDARAAEILEGLIAGEASDPAVADLARGLLDAMR